MKTLGTIREFRTKNFKVIVDAVEEFDLDLSWDEDGSISEQLDSGELIAFCARVRVVHRPTGIELGQDFLGNCVYKDLDSFMDHKECGKQNREYEAQGVSGRCGSYFTDMIHEAITEARATIHQLKDIR